MTQKPMFFLKLHTNPRPVKPFPAYYCVRSKEKQLWFLTFHLVPDPVASIVVSHVCILTQLN